MFFKIGVLIEKIYEKENPPQVFSCKYCEIFKNTYFEEHLETAASALTITIIIKLVIRYWASAGKSMTWNGFY